MRSTVERARRVLRKPPRVILRRIATEALAESERIRAPLLDRRFGEAALLDATSASSLQELWAGVCARAPFPPSANAAAIPDVERAAVVERAERALLREVDLLGSGPTTLGTPVDWHADFKSGRRWPPRFFRSIEYVDRSPSDVKVPWELSRMQWLLPAGQAYALTGDERYALAVRELLCEWIDANPYARSVNWAVTMEVALRVIAWSWLLGACGQSEAWRDDGFRSRFLRMTYLHGLFAERHIERSDVNGNHYTADAAGLTVAGLLFAEGSAPRRWAESGWAILCEELPRQVHPDGVDFEASTAYHRLVAELFLLPALYREQLGLPVPEDYRETLRRMARFTAAYTRPDGRSPYWGDADDARVLPMAAAPPDDHRHLVALVAAAWGGVPAPPPETYAEALWIVGRASEVDTTRTPEPQAFDHGGVYVLAAERDHVFIDCGPIGLAGRGGHGHNDCLSIDAFLDGVHLVADPGSYVYTQSWEWRNAFRRTAAHNTPQVDDEEQNRFVEGSLWLLHDDAVPQLRHWAVDGSVIRFVGAHSGYIRLRHPVTPVRTVELDTETHRLTIVDAFEGDGSHAISVPLQLAIGVEVAEISSDRLRLHAAGRWFSLSWTASEDWEFEAGSAWVSPSYGVKESARRLEWRRRGRSRPLRITIEPVNGEA